MIILIFLFLGVLTGLLYFTINSNSNKEQKAPDVTTISLALTSKDSIEANPVADSAVNPVANSAVNPVANSTVNPVAGDSAAKPVAGDSAANPVANSPANFPTNPVITESSAKLAGDKAIAVAAIANKLIYDINGNTQYSVIKIATDDYKINLENAINKAKEASYIPSAFSNFSYTIFD